MKRDIAKAQHLFSYMEQLREEYESTNSGISVVSEVLVLAVLCFLCCFNLVCDNHCSGSCTCQLFVRWTAKQVKICNILAQVDILWPA